MSAGFALQANHSAPDVDRRRHTTITRSCGARAAINCRSSPPALLEHLTEAGASSLSGSLRAGAWLRLPAGPVRGPFGSHVAGGSRTLSSSRRTLGSIYQSLHQSQYGSACSGSEQCRSLLLSSFGSSSIGPPRMNKVSGGRRIEPPWVSWRLWADWVSGGLGGCLSAGMVGRRDVTAGRVKPAGVPEVNPRCSTWGSRPAPDGHR